MRFRPARLELNFTVMVCTDMRGFLPSSWQLTSCSTSGAGTESTMSLAVMGHGPRSWSQAAWSAGAIVEARAKTRRPRAGRRTFIMSISSSSAMSAAEFAMESLLAVRRHEEESLCYSATVWVLRQDGRSPRPRRQRSPGPAVLLFLARSRARSISICLCRPPVLARTSSLLASLQCAGSGMPGVEGVLPHTEEVNLDLL